MPRAPHSSALLAGRPLAKRSVFSISMSRTRSMPLSSVISTRLTRGTGHEPRPCGCQMKASAAAKSGSACGRGASRSSASAIRVKRLARPARSAVRFGAGFRLRAWTLIWPSERFRFAAPLAGRLAPRKAQNPEKSEILGPFSRIARRCNWSADRYIPRTFRAPLGRQAPPGQPPHLAAFRGLSCSFRLHSRKPHRFLAAATTCWCRCCPSS